MQEKTNRRNLLRMGGVLVLAVIAIAGYTLSHSARANAMTRGFHQDMAQMMHGHDHHMDPDHMVAMMTDYLDLTETQQTQIRAILTAGAPNMEALHKQMRQAHQAVMATALQAPFDEAKVRATITQDLQQLVEPAVQMAHTHAQIYALLTPEQQAKMAHHFQKGMSEGPGSPEEHEQ
jgi:periplasmic protein CpxP/Spy